MPLDTKREAVYYNLEKHKAARKLISEGINEMIMLMLKRAFTEGYNAKDRYQESLKEKGQPK